MKKILHIVLYGPYTEGLSYQDNLLPKYQYRLGYEVVVVASTTVRKEDGRIDTVPEETYINMNGVRVIRIWDDDKKGSLYRFRKYSKLSSLMTSEKPDIIFLHGCQFRDAATVAQYMKEHSDSVRLYVDNHVDYENSARSFASKYILHRVIWRYYAKMLEPFADVFWGVLPSRVEFLVENYGLGIGKCNLLVMGADDDEVERASDALNRSEVRKRLGVGEGEFLLVTGGKYDDAKSQILEAMLAVKSLPLSSHIKYLIFGPVAEGIKEEFDEMLDDNRIIYIPWASTKDSYDYFSAADAALFPFLHSVYWEQVVGMRKPLIVKSLPGITHIDFGGNVIYLKEGSCEEIESVIDKTLLNKARFGAMKDAARSEKAEQFLYSGIAKRSIS